MTSIILAAGMGRRLSLGIPKCLIDMAGVSILKRQIAAFRAVGVDRFVLVVGFGEAQVRRHLADLPGADVLGTFIYLLNPRFAETNTIYSLYLAREHFGDGFFYANGDVVFDQRLAALLLPADGSTVMAVKPGRCGQEEVKVMVADERGTPLPSGRIDRIGKELDPACCVGEFVGVARFGSDLVQPLTDMLSHCVEAEGIVGDHFERAVDRLCAAGQLITSVDIRDLPCGEIDFPEDLDHARRELAPRLQD